jgi:hypothetical protein
MLRALSLTLLILVAAPVSAGERPDGTVVAQENKPAQQAPKPDCERNQEGVSA